MKTIAKWLLTLSMLAYLAACGHIQPVAAESQTEIAFAAAMIKKTGTGEIGIESWPADSKIRIDGPFPNIVRVYMMYDLDHTPLSFSFNEDASKITIELPKQKPAAKLHSIVLEGAERSAQHETGLIVLSALDAEITGDSAKLESHPGSHRIGFWTNAADSVAWDYKPTRWGMYDVELVYSNKGGAGTKAKVHVGSQVMDADLDDTGSWYRYETKKLGRVYLATEKPKRIVVRCKEKTGGAVMNLKAVILRPAPEGEKIEQHEDGSVLLHSRDSTVHGTKLRYEPAEKKNTLGYWVNPTDYASWQFEVTKPGRFDVEVSQGCGKGQGGSLMQVECGESLEFVVEDTGHFQNFKPRIVGQITLENPGRHQLTVKGVKKAKNAFVDIRQIRLIPVR